MVEYSSLETTNGVYRVGFSGVKSITREPGKLIFCVVYADGGLVQIPSTEIMDLSLADPAKYGLKVKEE